MYAYQGIFRGFLEIPTEILICRPLQQEQQTILHRSFKMGTGLESKLLQLNGKPIMIPQKWIKGEQVQLRIRYKRSEYLIE